MHNCPIDLKLKKSNSLSLEGWGGGCYTFRETTKKIHFSLEFHSTNVFGVPFLKSDTWCWFAIIPVRPSAGWQIRCLSVSSFAGC